MENYENKIKDKVETPFKKKEVREKIRMNERSKKDPSVCKILCGEHFIHKNAPSMLSAWTLQCTMVKEGAGDTTYYLSVVHSTERKLRK